VEEGLEDGDGDGDEKERVVLVGVRGATPVG